MIRTCFFAITTIIMAACFLNAGTARADRQYFQIQNWQTKQCLEITEFKNNNGAGVGIWDCWGGANQKWYWDGDQIRNQMNNKCLEVLGLNAANGAHAGMWDCWGGANQRWNVADFGGGVYLRSIMHWKCLEMLSFDRRNGAPTGLWDCWSGWNQAWILTPVSN